MLSDTLKEFDRIYDKLWHEIRDERNKKTFVEQNGSPENILLLEGLIKRRVFQLSAFEILLRLAPENALSILTRWYLSLDLSNHVKDQAADLEVMFSDIKEILGEEQLKEILKNPEILSENRSNQRVIDAIKFAMDDN